MARSMLLSSLVPQLLPPSPAAVPRQVALPAQQHVCLRVTVPGDTPHAVRRQMHALLGDALGLYIVRHDARRKAVTVDLELAHADVDAVIDALLHGLPRATLGRITPLRTSHRRAHAVLH